MSAEPDQLLWTLVSAQRLVLAGLPDFALAVLGRDGPAAIRTALRHGQTDQAKGLLRDAIREAWPGASDPVKDFLRRYTVM